MPVTEAGRVGPQCKHAAACSHRLVASSGSSQQAQLCLHAPVCWTVLLHDLGERYNLCDWLPPHVYRCPLEGTAAASVQPMLHLPTWSRDTAAAAPAPALAAEVITKPHEQVVPVRKRG